LPPLTYNLRIGQISGYDPIVIFDQWSRFALYQGVNPLFSLVLEFQKKTLIEDLEIGKYEISGTDAFVTIQEYQTRPASEGFIEAHRKYLDIQVLLAGEELMGICPLAEGQPGSYDAGKDFLKVEGSVDFQRFKPGYFMVFHPQDGHMPGIQSGSTPVLVRKAVFKVVV